MFGCEDVHFKVFRSNNIVLMSRHYDDSKIYFLKISHKYRQFFHAVSTVYFHMYECIQNISNLIFRF